MVLIAIAAGCLGGKTNEQVNGDVMKAAISKLQSKVPEARLVLVQESDEYVTGFFATSEENYKKSMQRNVQADEPPTTDVTVSIQSYPSKAGAEKALVQMPRGYSVPPQKEKYKGSTLYRWPPGLAYKTGNYVVTISGHKMAKADANTMLDAVIQEMKNPRTCWR